MITPRSSDRRASERELSEILDGMGIGFYAVDGDWTIRIFNAEAEEHFGRSRQEMIGRKLWDIYPAAQERP